MEKNGGGGGAPTGCYKCGRAGHWSRDCPSNPRTSTDPHHSNNKSSSSPSSSSSLNPNAQSAAAKKSAAAAPRSRPKLTPQLLLSDDGLGYVLRHFPPSFSYHGPAHEVRDLGNLLGMYAEWHSRLLPYYSFHQFVHKVEQVGATRRVKLCIRDLRDRVSNGGDPTKLHEDDPIQLDISNQEQETVDVEEPSLFQDANPLQNHNTEDFQEAMIQEIYEKATEEPSQTLPDDIATAYTSASKEMPSAALDSSSTEAPMSEEQKARIEANRLKALERASARSRSSQAA